MALFSSICSSFSSFNLSQNASSSPFPRSPVILKNPVTKPPKISVSTSPHSVRPVTCNSNDPSSNGSSRIFIKGLPLSTTEGFLAKTFSRFGTVTKAKIITERSSKQSVGFAYVWFDCEEAAQLAVEDMDGKFVDGRFVAVTLARPESPTSHVRWSMRICLSGCIQAQPWLSFPAGGGIHMDSYCPPRWKEKVVIVMGATGTGKSRLSIELATHFPAEIVNSDKIQVYQGLDIVTNKVTDEEQRGVPHHLLGVVNPEDEFTALDFRHLASLTLESITMRRKLPIIAGGSNSYIEALVEDQDLEFRSKYDCCFLWVDVALPVLNSFLSERVDRMVEAGLVEEVRNNFDRATGEADYTHGIRRAIGLRELDRYLRSEGNANWETRSRLLEEAIDEIKANTIKLACCQAEKIHRLRRRHGWEIHRIDATDVFRKGGQEAEHAWEMLVAQPSISQVEQFLYGNGKKVGRDAAPTSPGANANPIAVAPTPPGLAASMPAAIWWGPQMPARHAARSDCGVSFQ